MDNKTGMPVPFTFSRASSATLFDTDKNMQLVGADIPRVDYGNYLDSVKLLIEKESTNYAVTNSIITDNGVSNITNNEIHYVSNVGITIRHAFFTPTYNVTNTKNSIWIKNDGRRYILLRGYSTSSSYIVVDTLSKEIVNKVPSDMEAGIVATKDDYIWVQYERSTINYGRIVVILTDEIDVTANPTSIGDGTGVFAKNLQIETDNYTSYIPTTDTQVTRSADQLSYTLQNESSVYLKTTKQETTFTKPSGLWNIEQDLNNEGIEVLAIL